MQIVVSLSFSSMLIFVIFLCGVDVRLHSSPCQSVMHALPDNPFAAGLL